MNDMGEATIDAILSTHAQRTPDRPAITLDGRTLTYRQMDRRVDRLAHGLADLGVKPGDRVAFLGRNQIEHFEIVFAVARLGGITVGMNWRLSAAELAAQFSDCSPVVVFASPEAMATTRAARDLAQTDLKLVVFNAEDEGYEALIGQAPDHPRDPASRPDDICMICYTSGTTGQAKGVAFTHASLHAVLAPAGEAWRFDADSVSLVCMPTFHTAGLCWGLLALFHGGRDVVVSEFDAGHIVDLMRAEGVTNAVLAPIMLEQIIADLERRAVALPDLRAVVYGAAPITEPVLRRAVSHLDAELIQGYGLTEVNGTISILTGPDHVLEGPTRHRLKSAGQAVPWGAIRVVDPETGHDLPPGEVGEVWGKSPGLMTGYWQRPKETAETITPDGWLRTGDAGYLDADGYLFLTDRIKDMIVSGGENVYPIEIEHVLAAHPAVDAVAVIGVPDSRWGEAVKAVVVARAGHQATADELIAWARARLASYKCPKSLDFVEAMPRNASGKILKRTLREAYWAGHDRRIG
jgi:long-chain acyl-CoA synthetase